jgi:heme exporter protein C
MRIAGGTSMGNPHRILARLYWGCTLALAAAGSAMALSYAPADAGAVWMQRIFFLHLPAAINMFIAALVVFGAGVGYLGSRRTGSGAWDDLGRAAAEVAVLCCSVVLVTGMIWAHTAWGTWWAWSPRLTFSLVLWLLYASYLAIPRAIGASGRRAIVSAIFGIVAFIDVPLVYLSVKLLPDLHPSTVELSPRMQQTLLLCLAPVTMACAGLIAARFAARRRAPASDGPELPAPGLPAGSIH